MYAEAMSPRVDTERGVYSNISSSISVIRSPNQLVFFF